MTNTFSVESKSQLAKLLAVENINIVHQKISTAAFNPATRTLYCPIWEKMAGPLYDLLIGHEVGHAHDTPADGWHDAVSTRGKNYKGFLNVVEDARIEKRIKRRYPGLRKSFVLGYQDLLERNFFGIKNKDINTLPFIDRINLYTKSDYTLDVEFTDEEKVLLEKIKAMETWQDTLDVTELLWAYSKEEQTQIKMDAHNFEQGDEESEITEDTDGNGDADGDDEEENNESSDRKSASGDADEEDDEESDEEGAGTAINRDKKSKIDLSDFEPTCGTDQEFRFNEQKLVDKFSRPYNYIKLPTPILSEIITPAKRLHEVLTEEFAKQKGPDFYTQTANTLYGEFKRKNERYISMLAKEFEMRKAADKFSKIKVSATGDIDISKIYQYKTEDSIFRKMAKIPKGKSHGLVLLLDKSGSMAENMASSIEQILVLAMFCRKVNIPFVVYGFGNSLAARMVEYPATTEASFPYVYGKDTFSKGVDELEFSNVYLREYLNSKMGNSEFQKAVKNLVCLMSVYTGPRTFFKPPSEQLSNTPLSESLVALQPIINDFRKVNRLDFVNLAIIHDGDADGVESIWTDPENNQRKYLGSYDNNILTDVKNKFQVEIDSKNDDSMRIAISKWLMHTTGVKIFGFFLVSSGERGRKALYRRYHSKKIEEIKKLSGVNHHAYVTEYREEIKQAARTLKKEKFLDSSNEGYEAFYMLPNGEDLTLDDDDIVVTGKVTTNSLTKAFMKYTKDRKVNRVLVTKFIQGIAA